MGFPTFPAFYLKPHFLLKLPGERRGSAERACFFLFFFSEEILHGEWNLLLPGYLKTIWQSVEHPSTCWVHIKEAGHGSLCLFKCVRLTVPPFTTIEKSNLFAQFSIRFGNKYCRHPCLLWWGHPCTPSRTEITSSFPIFTIMPLDTLMTGNLESSSWKVRNRSAPYVSDTGISQKKCAWGYVNNFVCLYICTVQ